MTFDEIVNSRRSVRIYDVPTEKDTEIINKNLERAVLSPNSSNMPLWEFYQVSNSETKNAIAKACLNQSAARTASQLIVCVTRQDKWQERAKWNLENLKKQFEGKELTQRDKRAFDYYGKLMPLFYRNNFTGINTLIRFLVVLYHKIIGKPIIHLISHADQRVSLHKTCALAAQTFMLGMKSDGYDTCPMEGFDEAMVMKILGLPSVAEICMIIACGRGKEEGIYSERTRMANNEVIFKV